MTFLENELNKLLSKKCPIHLLYMRSYEGLSIMSEVTNGSYFPYNNFAVDSSVIFIVQSILQQIQLKSNIGVNLLQIFQGTMI
jgi:hypothetical protein